MSRQRLRSPRKRKRWVARSESRSDHAGGFDGETLSPILQLQHTLGNQRVAQLIQARRLTPQGKIIGLQRKLTVDDAAGLVVQRDNHGQGDTDAERFAKRDRVAVQIMIRVLRDRRPTRPDLENLSVELRAEQKEWIVQLWSAATGQSGGGAARLTMPERHEALASGMRGALRLADQYALEVPSSGKTMRVELRDALQTLRTDLYAADSKPTTGGPFGFGFVPKIVGMGREPQQARKGAPLSDQPAELREVVYLSFPSRANPKEPEKWFGDLTDRQQSAFTALYNALRAKDLIRFVHTIHNLDNGEPHFWGAEQEGNTVSLKVVGDSDGLNQLLGDPGTQREIALDSPFMAMMHKGQKSYRERTSGPGLHISVGPGKFWDVHIDAHPPVQGQENESDADVRNRFLMHGLQELFPNMPRAALIFLLKKVYIPPHIAKKIGNQALPAIRFFPATDSPLWRSDNPALIKSLEIQALEPEGRHMTATVGISTRF